MSHSRKQFYISTPDGDMILTEVFQEDGTLTILLGEDHRIDLDTDSAFELAESLLILANETINHNE